VERLADQPGVTRLGSLDKANWPAMTGRGFGRPVMVHALQRPVPGDVLQLSRRGSGGGMLCCRLSGWRIDRDRQGRPSGQGIPNGDRWRAEIIDGIVEALSNPTVQHHAECQGPPAVSELGWRA